MSSISTCMCTLHTYACLLFTAIYNSASSTTIQSVVDECQVAELSCCTDGIFTHVTLILHYGLADHTIIQTKYKHTSIESISHFVKIRLRNYNQESCSSALIYVMSKFPHLSPPEHHIAVRASQVRVQRPLFIISVHVHWSGFSLFTFLVAMGFVPYLTNIRLKGWHNTWPC